MPRDREAPARGGRSRRRNLPPPPGGCSAHASIPRLAPWATLFRPAGWRSVLAYFYAQIHASSFGIRNPATPKSRTRLQVDRGQPHAVVLILEQCVRGQNDSQYPAGLRHACLLQRVRPKPLSRADRCVFRVRLSSGTPVLRPTASTALLAAGGMNASFSPLLPKQPIEERSRTPANLQHSHVQALLVQAFGGPALH